MSNGPFPFLILGCGALVAALGYVHGDHYSLIAGLAFVALGAHEALFND